MANADNALLRIESGQQSYPMDELLNTGDNRTFEGVAAPWSGRGGFEPNVRPDGLITGGAITAGAGNNSINIAALTCYLAGVQVAVAGSTGVSVTRAEATDTHIIHSITVSDTGVIAVVSGTDSTSFSETRGVAGGPPLIPVGSIEIGQVRLSSATAGPVTNAEIYQVVGLHQERYDFPTFQTQNFTGEVVFDADIPAIHTGSEPKGVYASYATPIFAEVPRASNVVVPEEAFSVSSEAYYGGSLGSVSRSLNQGTFRVLTENGITDSVVRLKGETLWFEFLPNRFRNSEKLMYQGILGINRQWPAEGAMAADCTVSASNAASEVSA